MRYYLLAIAAVAAVSLPALGANDWPQFRGPRATGVADDARPPYQWAADKNRAWVAEIPGRGWSQPVVTGGKVLVTTAVPAGANFRWELHCLDLATGEPLWTKVALDAAPRLETHRDNTYATETPVTDGKHVFTYFGMMGLFCHDLDGELVWQKDLGVFPMDNGWGTASSPVLHDGKLFLQVDNEESSFVVALDATSGDELWRAERDEVSNWSTPLLWTNSQRAELVVGGRKVVSYEPATGKELWSIDIGGRSSASPTSDADLVVFGGEDRTSRGGTPGGLFAVRAGASGALDVSAPAQADAPGLAWSNVRGAPGMASPLVYRGIVYCFDRRGATVKAYDVATGELAFRERLPGGAPFWASPWATGGRVYAMDEVGTTFVLAAGKEYDLLGSNQLAGDLEGRYWATPAVAGDALVVRSETKLACFR
ncbi:MAG: PQQ-binding-like beta-propeller repeat protein [Lacipirellulaceae bacterium]